VRGAENGLLWRGWDRRAPHLHHIFWSFSGVGPLTLYFGLQQMATQLQKRTLIELIPLIEQMASGITEDLHMVPAALALVFVEGDRIDDARRQLNEYVGTSFEFVVDPSWIIGMCGFAEGAVVVGDPTYAAPC